MKEDNRLIVCVLPRNMPIIKDTTTLRYNWLYNSYELLTVISCKFNTVLVIHSKLPGVTEEQEALDMLEAEGVDTDGVILEPHKHGVCKKLKRSW